MDKITYLNDIEKEQVMAFNSNPTMKEAVKKILLAFIYDQGVLIPGKESEWRRNYALSVTSTHEGTNEELGAKMNAIYEACNLLEGGFADVEKFKRTETDGKKKPNPGS